MTELRPARHDDQAAVEAIVEAAYSVYLPRIGMKPGPMLDDYGALIAAGYVSVVEVDGGLGGLIVLIPEDGVLLLDNICVAPAAQGRGLGKRLLDFAESEARRLGLSAIRLYTHEAMVENQALYARHGYVETHRGEEKGLKRVFMRKVVEGT